MPAPNQKADRKKLERDAIHRRLEDIDEQLQDIDPVLVGMAMQRLENQLGSEDLPCLDDLVPSDIMDKHIRYVMKKYRQLREDATAAIRENLASDSG